MSDVIVLSLIDFAGGMVKTGLRFLATQRSIAEGGGQLTPEARGAMLLRLDAIDAEIREQDAEIVALRDLPDPAAEREQNQGGPDE